MISLVSTLLSFLLTYDNDEHHAVTNGGNKDHQNEHQVPEI